MFQFLCLSTTRIKGKVSWGQIAQAEERALLTSASTSFFLMPSEESSRLCSFSSSLSARSLAWRIFCRSSVASVLAFTAWQEKGGQGTDVYMDLCGGKKTKTEKAGDSEHIRASLQNQSIHLLHILCKLGTLFFNIAEFGTSLIVKIDVLLFLGMTDNLLFLQFNAIQRTKQRGTQD